MQVLITTGVYKIGGPATYTRLLAENLPKHGIGVDFLTFDQVRYLPKIIRHLVFFVKILAKYKSFDIVFAQDPVSVGLPSWLAVKILRKKLVIRFVGDYAWEQSVQRFGVSDGIDVFQHKKYTWRTEILRKIQVFVLNQADNIITPSIYFGNIAKDLVKDRDKVQPIYNGIDTRADIVGKIQAREQLNLSIDQLILFSAGRLVNWKGYDTLIDIMSSLVQENDNYRLFIAGDGPDQEKLKEQAKNLQVEKYVVFLGSLKREDLLLYLQSADIFILNTGFESFSFQVVEAMYYGVPVITTNRCNLPEIITDQKDGLLVEYDKQDEIKYSISRLLTDQIFRENIINNAAKRAQDFSIDKTVSSVIDLFKNFNKNASS